MQPAISLLKSAQEQMEAISADAQTATASPANLQVQISLLQQNLTELKQAVLLLSAPKGIALSSGEHLQLSASENLIATAGKNADVSVGKNFYRCGQHAERICTQAGDKVDSESGTNNGTGPE